MGVRINTSTIAAGPKIRDIAPGRVAMTIKHITPSGNGSKKEINV